MDIALIHRDTGLIENVIVAASVAAAQALFPDFDCVDRANLALEPGGKLVAGVVTRADQIYVLTAAQVAALVSAEIAAMLASDTADDKRFKALILVILDEFNAHATKINAILSAVDGAATLAALKIAVAAIVDYPQRAPAQLKAAVMAKINAGLADG